MARYQTRSVTKKLAAAGAGRSSVAQQPKAEPVAGPSTRTRSRLAKALASAPTPIPSPAPPPAPAPAAPPPNPRSRPNASREDPETQIRALEATIMQLRARLALRRRNEDHWRGQCTKARAETEVFKRRLRKRDEIRQRHVKHLLETNRILRQANRAAHDRAWTDDAAEENKLLRRRVKTYRRMLTEAGVPLLPDGEDDGVEKEVTALIRAPRRKPKRYPVEHKLVEGVEHFWPSGPMEGRRPRGRRK